MRHVLCRATACVVFGGTLLPSGHQVHYFNAIASAAAQPVPPTQAQVELDNDAVLVLRLRMAPGERTAMHDLTARLVIWLTDAHLRDIHADGTITEYRRTAGQADWVPAQRHAGKNLSGRPIEFLAVVPKAGRQFPPAELHQEHR
jgi:hypothetical protein